LRRLCVPDVLRLAREEGIGEPTGRTRQELVLEVARARHRGGSVLRGGGTLELLPEGYGFLRRAEDNYRSTPHDVSVAPAQVRALSLRAGVQIEGIVRPPRDGEQVFALLKVESVNGREPSAPRVAFENLTPLHADYQIFEEFKGTGNMELHLDRRLVEKRVWPAIDVNRSGTRREELLLHPDEAERVRVLRRVLADMHPVDAMELLTNRLRKTGSNTELLLGAAVRLPNGRRRID
jgi:transcription termination factor Rho